MKIVEFFFLLLFLFSACHPPEPKEVHAGVSYTCSMHPQVLKDEPGQCPICHMDLIPVQAPSSADSAMEMNLDTNVTSNTDSTAHTHAVAATGDIELTDQQMQLGNIKVDTLGTKGFQQSSVLAGTVALNEKNIETISARVRGRIERLYFKNEGDYVPKGAKVYELYSEELNSAKQEYSLLLQRKAAMQNSVISFDELLAAARQKLLLWGMSGAQVTAIHAGAKPSYTTPFYSPAAGYITVLNATEGAYVNEGQSLMRLANTSSVWVETQAYASQLAQVGNNASVTVQLPQLDNKQVEGRIEFATPEINRQSRISLLRVSLANPGNLLKPGMPAYIYIKGARNSNVISLPHDAVMRTTNGAYVWVQKGNRTFSMKTVVTGAENGNVIEIRQGLQPGEVIVTAGTYLLNSEYLLRNGTSSMEGMKM